MIALVVSVPGWYILLAITIISFLGIHFYPYGGTMNGGNIPIPDSAPLIRKVLWIILNLVMWLIYFIVN
jgi:hypothetical protein